MSGRFTQGALADEWCERRLLARIHRYTIKRLRAEIEPVAARDFLRFLFKWQRVSPDAQVEGPKTLDTIIAQLEGFGAPAGAWESEILPARLTDYRPAWLDARCLAGHATWIRLAPRNGRAAIARPAGPRAHHARSPWSPVAMPPSGARCRCRPIRCVPARAPRLSSTS